MVDRARLGATFGLLERYSVQDDTGSALRPRRSTGRGAPLTGAKRTAASRSAHFALRMRHAAVLSRQTLISHARSRGMKRRGKGEGETRKTRGEGQPPLLPVQSFSLVLLLHGRRGPQIANPLSTASFSRLSGRRGGGRGMGVPYSAGAAIRETRPKMQAKDRRKRKNASSKADRAFGMAMRIEDTRSCK